MFFYMPGLGVFLTFYFVIFFGPYEKIYYNPMKVDNVCINTHLN